MGRLTLLIQRDSNGIEILKREQFYDLNGNKSVEITNSQDQIFRIEWSYGPMNRLESIKESTGNPEEKITQFTYTEQGQLASKLNSGSEYPILYTYNRNGNLHKISHQSGKDTDFSNRYSYDRNGNIISSNALGGIDVYRKYDAFNQLLEEEFKDEIGTYQIHYSYDKLGRRTKILLPDGSSLRYTYDAFFPRSVSRYSKGGETLFTHSYDQYNQSGQVIHETLFGFCGDQKFSYGFDGTKKSIESDFIHDIILKSNQLGEVTQMETRIEGTIQNKEFFYDQWGHLILEPEHSYSFDGLRNRISKDDQKYILNTANQILSDSQNSFSYDSQGRLIQKEEWKFAYDPLGDLITADKGELQVAYTYDSFGRRLNRTQYNGKGKRRTKINTQRFFYLGCEEIGRLQDNEISECKILGAFEEPLAIEEKGEFIVTFCDLQGNIIALADPENREILGFTQWSAFGEKVASTGRQSTWGYQGKREDPLTKFIAFGKRDYDPSIGRWTTPDPSGFIEGPNLYQYSWNNPLSFKDRWGLSCHEDYFYGEVEPHCFCERHRDCKRGGDFRNINPSPYPSTPTYTYQGALWNPSNRFDLSDMALPELPKGQLGFINGMATKFDSAKDHALYLSKLAGGFNIHAVYNATHSAPIDFLGCAKELYEFRAPAPVCKLHQNWDSFFSKAGDNELYLQFCHSEGAILIRNALLGYPDHLRKRIIVVAIAPGAYIPKEICYRSIHYVSTRDFVPLFDKTGRRMCQGIIKRLKPHPKAPFLDHDFQSKTYEESIVEELTDYFKMVQLW